MVGRRSVAAGALAGLFALAGCGSPEAEEPALPSWEEVRSGALQLVDEVNALMPDGSSPTLRPEGPRLSCGEGRGQIFTATVDIALPEGTDVDALLKTIVASPPEGWGSSWPQVERPTGLYLDPPSGESVSMVGTYLDDGSPYLGYSVMSHCGESTGVWP